MGFKVRPGLGIVTGVGVHDGDFRGRGRCPGSKRYSSAAAESDDTVSIMHIVDYPTTDVGMHDVLVRRKCLWST